MTEDVVLGGDRLQFNWNPNNKLTSEVFTAFVPYNPRYQTGHQLSIWLNGRCLKRAEILDLKRLMLDDVNEWIARVDTGLSIAGFREHLRETYGGQMRLLATQPWHFLLLRTVH